MNCANLLKRICHNLAMIGSTVAFPVGVILIKLASQACDVDSAHFICEFAVTFDGAYEFIGWILLVISMVVSPLIAKKVYWVTVRFG